MAESIDLLVFSKEFDDYDSTRERGLYGVLTDELRLGFTGSSAETGLVYESRDTELRVLHKRGRIMAEDGSFLREISQGKAFEGKYAFVFTGKFENHKTMLETLCDFFQQREYTRLW